MFSTPENLLVGISKALGTQESHFLSKNMFWENAVGYLINSACYSFQTFAIVFSNPENILVGISMALETKESHFLWKNMFSENAGRYLRNDEYQSFQTSANMFSTLENFLVGISGVSRNTRKPLSKLKHVLLRKCCGVSHKQCMLELSNLCNCVHHPWNLISRDF